MKTTNYEISKKLKEIGFNTPAEKCWAKIRLSKTQEFTLIPLTFDVFANCDEWFPSYDLETLIDALPEKIEFRGKEYCFWMQWSGSSDCYIMGYVHGNLRATELEVSRYDDENKSLADIAGEMWLILKKKGLI